MRVKRRLLGALKGLGMLLAVAAVAVFFSLAVNHLDTDQGEQRLLQLEAALRRSCAACYAAEGVYPPDLDYLEEHYGIRIDESRYKVFYTVNGSNLMPDITVLELERTQ